MIRFRFEKVRLWLRENQRSVCWLVEKTSIPRATMNRILKGALPSLDYSWALAKVMGASLESLVEDLETPESAVA
jgi:hypothetical protein